VLAGTLRQRTHYPRQTLGQLPTVHIEQPNFLAILMGQRLVVGSRARNITGETLLSPQGPDIQV
jgi:hypothetical protein